jgi:phage baseplate assembly protein W
MQLINPQNTAIVFDFTATNAEEIYACLRTLFSTPVGTVALDRDFGIDFSILDHPVNIAQSRYSVELNEKIRKYEPRVKIKEVSFEADGLTGTLYPKVVVELARY